MKVAGIASTGLLLLAGCTYRFITNTPRSATEQLLLTRAVDMALEKFQLDGLRRKKVFLDFASLEAYDAAYIRVAVSARFCQLGATLADEPKDADMIAQVACGCSGTEFERSLVGLPSVPLPNAPVPVPEVALWKQVEQAGVVKLLIFLHANGEFISAHHYYAKADRKETVILWRRTQHRGDVEQGWELAELEPAPEGPP